MKIAYYFVYILICDNGAYYTGYTNDLTRRYQQHVLGKSRSKFTRSFKPLCIAQSWKIYGTRGSAMKVETFIKMRNKKEKDRLVLFPEKLADYFQALKIEVWENHNHLQNKYQENP